MTEIFTFVDFMLQIINLTAGLNFITIPLCFHDLIEDLLIYELMRFVSFC